MKRKVSEVERLMRNEQPISWGRAFVVGVIGATLMMGLLDSFNMMGFTQFSYETYIGSLIRNEAHGAHNWTVGVFANWFLGGIFGVFYAYFFEYFFSRASAREGLLLGVAHVALAAFAFFPFFNAIHEQMGVMLYPSFGILGSGLGVATPLLLIVGNLLFGATVGTLYGPVRLERVMTRYFEPGETGMPGEPGVISASEDTEDRVVA